MLDATQHHARCSTAQCLMLDAAQHQARCSTILWRESLQKGQAAPGALPPRTPVSGRGDNGKRGCIPRSRRVKGRPATRVAFAASVAHSTPKVRSPWSGEVKERPATCAACCGSCRQLLDPAQRHARTVGVWMVCTSALGTCRPPSVIWHSRGGCGCCCCSAAPAALPRATGPAAAAEGNSAAAGAPAGGSCFAAGAMSKSGMGWCHCSDEQPAWCQAAGCGARVDRGKAAVVLSCAA